MKRGGDNFGRHISEGYRGPIEKLLTRWNLKPDRQLIEVIENRLGRGFIEYGKPRVHKGERKDLLKLLKPIKENDFSSVPSISSITIVSKSSTYKFKIDSTILGLFEEQLEQMQSHFNEVEARLSYIPKRVSTLNYKTAKIYRYLQMHCETHSIKITKRRLKIITHDLLSIAYPVLFPQPGGADSYNNHLKAQRITKLIQV